MSGLTAAALLRSQACRGGRESQGAGCTCAFTPACACVPCCSYMWFDCAAGATYHAATTAVQAGACRRPLPPAAAAARCRRLVWGVHLLCWVCAQPLVQIGAGAGGHVFQEGKGEQQAAWYLPSHARRAKERLTKALPLEPFSLHLLPGACRPRAMWHAPPTSCKRSRRSTSSSSQALKCWTWAATPGPGCRCATPPVGKGGQCLLQRNTAWVATHEPSRKMPLRAALHAAGCLRVTGTREEGGPGDWS